MKQPYSSVYEYSMDEVIFEAGPRPPSKGILVFDTDEAIPNEKMKRPARSNHFTIALVNNGEHSLKINLIKYHLVKNSILVLPPGAVHEFGEKDDDFKVSLISFTPDFLSHAGLHKKHSDAFSFFLSQADPHILLDEKEAENINMLLLLLKGKIINDTDNPFRDEILHHGFNLFMFEVAAIFKKYHESESIRLTRKETILMSFIKLLSLHFKEERSVQFYAGQLFVTPKHLTKTVKEITSKTCGEMIDEMVITEAKILLDDSVMSVGNVADALHFSDQFFFSKFFKNHTGFNPSEYKAMM